MFASAPPEGAPLHPPRLARPDAIPFLAAPGVELPGPEGVEEFWVRVRERGTPLVAPDPQGSPEHAAVTFLWRGTATTRAVQVLPNKLGDPRAPRGNLMERVPGTDVWHWTLRLRRDWRGTYDFYVDEGDGPDGDGPGYWQWLRTRRRADPLNSRTLPRRWDGDPVSWAQIRPEPAVSDWDPRPEAPRGTVSVHEVPSAHLGEARTVWLYEPPAAGEGADRERLPVLVLLDGEHWQPHLGIANLLDNLIADGRIPPTAAILVDSVDSGTRWRDLACNFAHASFLAEELLPWAARRLPLTDDPARTVIAGQSLGGLSATYTALSAPHRFGNALVQSASYWWPNGPEPEWLTRRIAAAPRRPVRFRLSFGEQEWVALPAARRLREVLDEAGYDCAYREFNGGHDYVWWRTEMADGLTRLLGRG
ncbi:enterochelin esterase [Streptomyces sp. NBC_01218]|uniref:enterochelin esterase n=1 Tax=unclassified Streptomyces TaxID=2593676 RepID=UPI0023BA1B15|nr:MULTISPECIES: enterochelin esterase [unclassified Streptomyces]WEH38782.1 enterochelin esterase [Streptomyces sp. AM 2-1-1]WSQ50442.1 enterochelin esterase [Streptomyces sp. NBC_01218]